MTHGIRVLLVDDQELILAGLAMLLEAEADLEVVGRERDGAAALEAAERLQPDVVVMDVRMPGMDGVAATRLLTRDRAQVDEASPLLRVLILTTYHADEAVYAALRAGASGFLLKDAAPTELVSAIRALAGGEAWLTPPVARRLLTDFVARTDPAIPPPLRLHQLTPREIEVLVLVAHGLSNREVATRLFVAETTVKTHIGRVLMKLGLRDRAHAVAVAYQTGLVSPGEAPP
jgi:DNA-binding NarL/FixJ family response regulator